MIPVKVRTPKGDIVCKTLQEVNNAIAVYLQGNGSGSVSIHRIFGVCIWHKDCEHIRKDRTANVRYCGKKSECRSNVGFDNKVTVLKLVEV